MLETWGTEKTKQYLANLFKAHFTFIYIPTWEESRICELIEYIAQDDTLIKTLRDVYIWSQTDGLINIKENHAVNNVKDPVEALKYIDNLNKPAILILKDIHSMLGYNNRTADQVLIRKIRDVASSLRGGKPKNVVIVAPVLQLPVELQKEVTVVDFDLPSIEEIRTLLDDMIEANEEGGIEIAVTDEEKNILCKGAQGLTLQEAENAFARAMVDDGKLTIDDLKIIMEEKCQVIKKTGILEFVKSDINIDDVGGLENLKRWLKKRNNSWSDKAQKSYNLPTPKGILITGVPGCGKSLTAKAMSAMWKLPLLRLDIGKIFSGIVGSSEQNMRNAIKTAEAVAPSILWIDEIEKGFGNGSERDGGTSTRIFGTFLTWMQEKTKPVFVIATSNNISSIPAEMLRKGRFDEIFFVDLPTLKEREIIFKLHLQKRLKDSVSKDFKITDVLLHKLARLTEGFVGAEIEQIVISALFEAFSNDRKLLPDDLLKVIKNTVPLSVTQSEQIIRIRNWANERAITASIQSDRDGYDNSDNVSTNEKISVNKSRGGRTVEF